MLPLIFSAALRELWAPDEPRYAEVSKEIFEHGSALVMHLCGNLYPDKPPLLFWLSGFAGKLSNFSEFAMRWPSLLATFLTAWLIIVLARRWFGEMEARWAPVIFLSFAMVTEIGGRLQIDPLLTVLCTGALVLGSVPTESVSRRSAALIGAGLLVGFGALAKGPVAFINTGLVALAWWFLFRKEIHRPRVPAWVWLVTILAAVAPALIWAVSAAEVEPRLWNALFYDQHVGRVIKADRHPGPVWKYALRLPLFLTPWFFLIAGGLVSWWKNRQLKGNPDEARGLRSGEEGVIRALSWAAVLILFYSLIPPKRDLYLLPVYPAAALLAARALVQRHRSLSIENWLRWSTTVFTGLLAVGIMASGFIIDDLPGLKISGLLAGFALLLGTVGADIAARRKRPLLWAGRLAMGWLCFSILITLLIFPPLNAKKSARSLALDLADRPEKPVAIPFVGRVRPEGYRFYAGIPAVYSDELDSHLRRDGNDFLGVIAPANWKALPIEEKEKYRILEDVQVGGKKMIILGKAED